MIGLPDLTWFPKPFGAGDTDGTGATRVLGQPDVDLQNLLVRETAQNSWDAALEGRTPLYELRHRVLDDVVRDVLTWNVFRGSAAELGLEKALGASQLTAIEIVDRNTKGLGGPTRNDLQLPPDSIKDFADFVLTIGAPPDHQQGGGTYGFGKTAAYLASQCSTIVIWSKAVNAATGLPEERFIASAMGPSFNIDGQRFTGRQWWGLPTEDGPGSFRFEPAVGRDARQLGQAVFERHFTEEETGTSLLILQPHPADNGASLVDAWLEAIMNNLWPKLAEQQDPRRRMQVNVYDEGNAVQLPDMATSALWQAKHECLEAIRSAQAGLGNTNPLVRLETIESYRPKAVLGHLAIRYVATSSSDPMTQTANTVTFMRSHAELVVKAQASPPSSVPGHDWVGVFKPAPDKDQAFAQSEPPAHDNWHPEGMQDKALKSTVTVALNRVKRKVAEFLTPTIVSTGSESASSTGAVSAALAGLAGSASGSRAAPTPKKMKRSGASIKTHRAEIKDVRLLVLDDEDIRAGRQRTLVTVTLQGPGPGSLWPSTLSIAVDGGALASEDLVWLEEWLRQDGTYVEDDQIDLDPGETVGAVISYPQGVAINFSFAATGRG